MNCRIFRLFSRSLSFVLYRVAYANNVPPNVPWGTWGGILSRHTGSLNDYARRDIEVIFMLMWHKPSFWLDNLQLRRTAMLSFIVSINEWRSLFVNVGSSYRHVIATNDVTLNISIRTQKTRLKRDLHIYLLLLWEWPFSKRFNKVERRVLFSAQTRTRKYILRNKTL